MYKPLKTEIKWNKEKWYNELVIKVKVKKVKSDYFIVRPKVDQTTRELAYLVCHT